MDLSSLPHAVLTSSDAPLGLGAPEGQVGRPVGGGGGVTFNRETPNTACRGEMELSEVS